MKRLILFILLSLCAGCSSIDLPETKESELVIASEKAKVDSIDASIRSMNIQYPSGNDVVVQLRRNILNSFLLALAGDRTDDIAITFYKSPGIIREDKKTLFVSYTNYIDIDGGSIVVDLKKIRFDGFNGNRIDAFLEIEGRGTINVSGKYMGVPAWVSPDVELRLAEPVSFQIWNDQNGNLVIAPQQKRLTLKTKTSIKLLAWSVPWNQDIPLELTDLIKPMTFPSTVQSSVQLPVPSMNPDAGAWQLAPFGIRLSNASVNAANDRIEMRTDIDLERQQTP
jgi:hypothetical protein